MLAKLAILFCCGCLHLSFFLSVFTAQSLKLLGQLSPNFGMWSTTTQIWQPQNIKISAGFQTAL